MPKSVEAARVIPPSPVQVVTETTGSPDSPLNEQALKSLRLFIEAVEQSPVAISITDPRANIIYVNRAFSEITGYSAEEAVGQNESMLSDKHTPPRVYEEMWARLGRRQSWNGILVNRHKEHGRYLADVTIAPILDENGELVHFIGIHRDVTEFYGLEQRVKNQKRLIETVVDSIPVAAVLLDEQDRVVLDNQVYKGLTSDLGVREPIQLFLELLREELGERWAAIKRLRKSFRSHEIRVDLGGNKPPRWFSCAGTWFAENDIAVESYFQQRQQDYLLLTLTDISQHQRQQEEIRFNALKAMMAEEERRQSLRETLSGVIHHVQAPYNLLTAAVNTLERRGGDGQTALLSVLRQVLEAEQKTLTTLQNAMPEASDTRLAPVNLNQVLHEVLILLTPVLLANGIVVDWQPTPVLPNMMAMENRLRAMFKQLFENAIDAMRANRDRPRELRIATRPEGSLIHVIIEDSGPGIPAELHTRVFEPFFTTRSGTSKRTGMGLAMVQEVVNRHAGIIMIDPDHSDGCRIRLQFDISH